MTTTPLTDQQHADIRREILAALSTAGAFCGECGFEPGESGCSDCVRVREVYASAVLAVVQPELDRLAAELSRVRAELTTARAAAFREAARVLEHTGRDDDAVNLLDNIADGIACHSPSAAPTS